MTKEQIQQMIDAYVEAELSVLAGKTQVINGKTFTEENLQEIRAGRLEWERRLNASTRPRGGYSLASFN